MEAVASTAPLHAWTTDAAAIPKGSPIEPTIEGVAWGRDMYQECFRVRGSLSTLAYGTVSGTWSNLRLFEATGMGALLVTEAKSNLGDLFKAGSEVDETSENSTECAEVVSHYLDHPHEAQAIAAAGQRRTLRDHTWRDRMERLVDMILRHGVERFGLACARPVASRDPSSAPIRRPARGEPARQPGARCRRAVVRSSLALGPSPFSHERVELRPAVVRCTVGRARP